MAFNPNQYRPYLGQAGQPPYMPQSPYFQDDQQDSPTKYMAMQLADPGNNRYGFTPSVGSGSGVGGGGAQAPAEEHVSYYAPPEGSEDADGGGGGGGDEDEAGGGDSKYLVSGNASWTKSAPEAAGSESLSTTPEGRAPRSSAPIEKADLPKVDDPNKDKDGQERLRAARSRVRDLDKQIESKTKDMGSWWMGGMAALSPAAANMSRSALEALHHERNEAARDAVWEENRAGSIAAAKEAGKTERAKAKATSAEKIASMHYDSIQKTGKVDDKGHFVYLDPETKSWREPTSSIPGTPNVLDTDNPEAPPPSPYMPSFASANKPKSETAIHNLPENVPSYLEGGVVKKNPNYVPPADRRGPGKSKDDDAAWERVYNTARAAHLRDNAEDEAGANAAARAAADDFLDYKSGKEGPKPGLKKNFANKDGVMEPFQLGKDGKWHKVVGTMSQGTK